MSQEIAGTETALESPVKEEPEAIVKEAFVTEEVTEAEDAPESLVQEERESVVEEAIVTKKLQKLTLHQIHQSSQNLKLFWSKQQ